MSKELTVAKRYARALYEASKDRNAVNEALVELQSVVSILEEQQELQDLLQHPNVDLSAKADLIKQIFSGNVSELVLNTLVLLVERRRSELIPTVYEQFVKVANQALGRADAVVYSPMALSEQETTAIAAKFSNVTGKNVHVTNIVDSSVLGGIKVRIGDTLYDGSLSSKLERMSKELQATQAL